MNKDILLKIPMPLIVSIEDVGWWSGKDGSSFNQPYRTGMQRNHVPKDYIALAALGRGLDMRILAGFVLCEWDKANLLRQVPSTTWMGDRWTVPETNRDLKEKAAWIIKKEKKAIEFGLHGVGHEFWTNGRMERTEFHDAACEMRNRNDIRQHLTCFFRLMDQYHFDFTPRTFIPPALKHSFGNPDKGFQTILNEFGIQYVTLVFNRAKIHSKRKPEKIAWENKVLLVERGEADVAWHTVNAPPYFKFDRPVMALHWANILHSDPEKNQEVIENWTQYIKTNSEKKSILLARDTRSCFTQYLHHTLSRIEKTGEEFSVDVSWMKKIPGKLAGQTLFLKVDIPPGISLKIHGATVLSGTRSAEIPFLKLHIPKKTTKIWLKPVR